MPARPWDWIVVGAGGAGSAISYALANHGSRVLALEQFRLNHERGSSHGRTRILRTAYSEGPSYVPLVLEARRRWLRLERAAGVRLFRPTGVLILGPSDGRVVSGALSSARSQNLPHELLDASEVARRFSTFRPSTDEVGLWDPKGGVLFPERAVASFVRLAERRGAGFEWGARVVRWSSTSSGVEVTTDRHSYRARGMILAGGAWTSRLAGDRVPSLGVERQTVFWIRPPASARRAARRMPAFVWQRHADGYFYGTPDFGDGVKVASDVGRPVRDPDRRNRGSGVRERRLVEAFVTKRLPRVRGSFVRSSNCLYTNTPDHDFLLDFHPDHSNVIVVSACSGHGFKFLPALGEAVATMARTGSLAPRWEGFALARFSGRRRRGNV